MNSYIETLKYSLSLLKSNLLEKKVPIITAFPLLDEYISDYFIKSSKQVDMQSNFALVATGSLARREFSFFSDIDIFIIVEDNNTELSQFIIENIVYPLWDLKMHIGYSVRNINEFIDFAINDVVEWTKVLDIKFISGSKSFYQNFIDRVSVDVFRKGVVNKNLKEVFMLSDDRRYKIGDLSSLLEPDIKNNPGGLRDINIIRWYNTLFSMLNNSSILNSHELRKLKYSKDFFLSIRLISHLLNNKKNDFISFDNQSKIAAFLYGEKEDRAAYIMKKFYFNSEYVDYLYQYIRDNFYSNFIVSSVKYNKKIDDNFHINDSKLCMKDYSSISQNLSLITKAFYYSQKFKLFLSYELREAIKNNVKKIKIDFIRDKKNINIFFEILEKGYGYATTLRKMNQLNFLTYFIPEFKKIKYKITYDMYHQYTVDIHSLIVVQELRNLFSGSYILEYPFITALSLNIPNKKIILFAGLLHDIGKGEDGEESHLIKGERIVVKILKRMGIGEKESSIMRFLVRNHTLMINTALRRDIKNEEEVINFANIVKSLENLNYLFLLSFADLKGVSPKSFDKWHYTLLQDLYIKTFSVISHKKFEFATIQDKIVQVKSFIIENIPQKEESFFDKFIDKLSRKLIQNFNEKEIFEIYILLKDQEKLPFVHILFNSEIKVFKVVVKSYNLHGIFNNIVGILTLNNLNIISAEIYTNLDGTIIDIFEVVSLYEDNYIDDKIDKYKKSIEDSLNLKKNEDFDKLIEDKILKKSFRSKKYNVIPIIKYNNLENEFFTILEIIVQDFPGVLYLITKVLSKRNIDIHSSKISTQGIKAIDTFYITDMNGNKIIDQKLQAKIESELLDLIYKVY